MSLLSIFRRDRRGNVAMIFALSLIPLVGMTGAAVDYSRIAQVRTKLADALDGGVLSGGSQSTVMTDKAAYDAVKTWVDAHMGGISYTLDSVTQVNGTITGKATTTVDMTLARILGVKQVPVSVTSEIIKSLGKIELVLVLDNTGSMKGTKLSTLRDAATKLVDSLSAATPNPADLKIGVVPFSTTVNVGSTYENATWMDTTGISPIANEIFTKPANRFTLFKQMDVSWGGCVESRPYPYDVQNDVPATGTPATLYVPFFASDEPDTGSGFVNNYLADYAGDSTWIDRQGDPLKYTVTPKTGTNGVGYQYGPNAGCELAPLQRLSSNPDQVKATIKNMQAIGDTNIPMGLAWGWNVIAPDGPFGDGVPYNDDEWTKVIVVMTDGQNQNTANKDKNDSYYSGVGYIWQNRIGVGAGSSNAARTAALDGRLTELCKNVKAAGKTKSDDNDHVVVYTVRVEVTSGSSAVLENCASDPKKFYDVQDVSNLVSVFNEIGGAIQRLRIAM